MTYISIIPFILITLLILIVAVLTAFAVTRDFKVGLRFRDELARRVRYLRLDKMLTKRNINLNHYLHTESVTNIENQIRGCESCAVTRQCDQILKQNTAANLSFCPNHDDLESIALNKTNTLQNT